jgi:2-polyprenyl-6-methoxyphenol hydroxylase-like FAD-dependent oxidoreductase
LGPALLDRVAARGVVVVGRAVHTVSGTLLEPYGQNARTDHYLAIGREDFRSVVTRAAIEQSARFDYLTEVTDFDLDGYLSVQGPGQKRERIQGDLLVGCDGSRGLARMVLANQPGVSSSFYCEPQQYITVTISPDHARRADLDRQYLQFWPSERGVSIGVPNVDGSFTVLIIGNLPREFLVAPFADQWESRHYLLARNRRLLDVQPDLPAQLVRRPRGAFYRTTIDRWTYGSHVALCGDAGRSSPAWLGTGACLAMDDAKTLADVIRRHDDLHYALADYNASRVATSRLIQELTQQHGRLLMTRLGSTRWRITSHAHALAERVFGKRSLFQRIAFDSGGLARELRILVNENLSGGAGAA